MRVIITVPRDRRLTASLSIEDEQFTCLCKADNQTAAKKGNPSRDPLKMFGDTPLGLYKAKVGSRLPGERSYGKFPVIRLTPTSGDALIAKQKGRRSGLLIHGGHLGPQGRLRPTNGCVRVSDETQERLIALMGSQEIECEIRREDSNVRAKSKGTIDRDRM